LASINLAGGSQAPLTVTVPHPHEEGRIRLPFFVGSRHPGTVLLSVVEAGKRSQVASAPIE
jgi:hypothetical protein